MSEIKRRTRTGCLTCRARRVKCDERKPACNRCAIANVECAGYAPRRHIEVRAPSHRGASLSQQNSPADDHDGIGDDEFRVSPQNHSGQSLGAGSTPSGPPSGPASGPAPSTSAHPALPRPQFRVDGLPLVGLRSNPRMSYRPCAAAREVLSYHQYFFRTRLMLFPADRLLFWRDRLYEEALVIEYAQRGILALGCMHRASLMTAMLGENDQSRALMPINNN